MELNINADGSISGKVNNAFAAMKIFACKCDLQHLTQTKDGNHGLFRNCYVKGFTDELFPKDDLFSRSHLKSLMCSFLTATTSSFITPFAVMTLESCHWVCSNFMLFEIPYNLYLVSLHYRPM